MLLGCHLSSANGFLAAGREALSIGANTFQCFTRNPRGGAASAGFPHAALGKWLRTVLAFAVLAVRAQAVESNDPIRIAEDYFKAHCWAEAEKSFAEYASQHPRPPDAAAALMRMADCQIARGNCVFEISHAYSSLEYGFFEGLLEPIRDGGKEKGRPGGIPPIQMRASPQKVFQNVVLTLEGWDKGNRPPDPDVSIDRIRGHVVPEMRLDIHLPKVVDPLETKVPDADKLSVGSVTFVNLDNDDDDELFDNGDDEVLRVDESTGSRTGDNELVKLRLNLSPDAPADATVRLAVPKGAACVAVWTNDTKSASARYIPGDGISISEFRREGDWLVKDLWAEGVAPHAEQRATEFSMECAMADGFIVSNRVALTVLGIESVRWRGRGNSRNDSDDLDDDPNWPTGLAPGSARVFPGARSVNGVVEPEARDKVGVEVTLSVAPPVPVNVYLRSFDMDDPSADESDVVDGCCVDNELYAWDNRGSQPRKEGAFVGNPAPSMPFELSFARGQRTNEAEFQTTLQPGDNFRVVANADSHFLICLENDDAPGQSNPDKQRIRHEAVAGGPAAREIREPAHYASNVLTVWRFFHLETDTVGGVECMVQSARISGMTSVVEVQHEPTIPFALRDDDVDAISTMPAAAMPRVFELFAPASIVPVFDGGGNMSNNDSNVPFKRNVASVDFRTLFDSHIGSMLNRKTEFWAGYGLYAFQPSAAPEQIGIPGLSNPPSADSDPDSEHACFAFALAQVGAFFFGEVARESHETSDVLWANLVAHEFAHILGAVDNYENNQIRPLDIMGTGCNNPHAIFQPAALAAMRSFQGLNSKSPSRLLFHPTKE